MLGNLFCSFTSLDVMHLRSRAPHRQDRTFLPHASNAVIMYSDACAQWTRRRISVLCTMLDSHFLTFTRSRIDRASVVGSAASKDGLSALASACHLAGMSYVCKLLVNLWLLLASHLTLEKLLRACRLGGCSAGQGECAYVTITVSDVRSCHTDEKRER